MGARARPQAHRGLLSAGSCVRARIRGFVHVFSGRSPGGLQCFSTRRGCCAWAPAVWAPRSWGLPRPICHLDGDGPFPKEATVAGRVQEAIVHTISSSCTRSCERMLLPLHMHSVPLVLPHGCTWSP
eukprot:NODE_4395_length_678_cov_316.487961.p4 GENE.NODE_4395_length_678_cov_316.487961~~NODE_4395_length_678_cov_316.487961.p4  ORF type:complete len:127 (-),score=5.61 NODE_4395_length_678_cov_316.487961:264-644(-)